MQIYIFVLIILACILKGHKVVYICIKDVNKLLQTHIS